MKPEDIRVGRFYSTEGGIRRVTRIERNQSGAVCRISYQCADYVRHFVEALFAPMRVYVSDWYPATAEQIAMYEATPIYRPERAGHESGRRKGR